MGYEVIRNPNRVPTFVSKGPAKKKKTSSRATAASTYAASQFAKAIAATKLVVGPHSGDPRGTSSYEGGHPGGWTANAPTSPYSPGPNSYTPNSSLGPAGPQGPSNTDTGVQAAADFGFKLAGLGAGAGIGGGGGNADTSSQGAVSVSDLLAALQPKAVDIGPAPTKAGVAGPAHYTPSLVDIASLIAPYGKARNDAVTQFANNKKQIETLGKGEQRDVQLQNKLEEANQKRLAADYAQQDAELHAHLSGLAKLGAGDIAGQGFTDPSVTAPIRAAADAETRSGDAQSKAGQRLIAGQSAEAQLDAHRQGVDAQAGTNAAQQQLSGNLSDIANSLNLQEASAKAQGERQNAQSKNEADQMNAKEQQQYMQNVMNANTQFQDASARYAQAQSGQAEKDLAWRQQFQAGLASSDAFVHPYQAKVQAEIADRLSNNPKDDHARILGNVFSASDNENDARKYLETALDREGKTVTPWYYDLIHKYYASDTSKVSAAGAKAARAFYR